MSELQGYHDIVLTWDAAAQTFNVGTNSIVYVFSEGAALNGAQTITGAAGQTLTVYDAGSFAINDYAQLGVAGPTRLVTAVGATTLTLGAGVGGTFATNTRVLNIGTAADKSVSHAVIYPVDQTSATPSTQPISADVNGNFFFFADTGDYDILIRNAGNTTDEYIIADVTLAAFIRSSVTGIVSLQSATDDFAVGGTTLGSGTPAFYVDESANKIYIRGNSGLFAAIDGANAQLILSNSGGQPSLLLSNTTGFTTTLSTSHTANRAIVLPDLAGTIALLSGTQTFTGALTFTGGMTVTTTALSLTSALTSTSTGYFQTGLNVGTTDVPAGGDLTVKRLKSNRGTALTSGAFVLSGTWGATATVAVDANSTDQRFSFTITSAGAGVGASPTCTITFTDGTWATAPFANVVRFGGTAAYASGTGNQLTWTLTATTLVITFLGTPSAGQTLSLSTQVWG